MEGDKMKDISDAKYEMSTDSFMSSSSTSPIESENEEMQGLENSPPCWSNRKRLSKQLTIETPHVENPRDLAWERRRLQMSCFERRRQRMHDLDDLTDEDLNELKGCIELGFGFNEEEGQKLCNTLPALDLYFAVNRQFAMSPVASPNSRCSTPSLSSMSSLLGNRSSPLDSPTASESTDSWKICTPGDSPRQVKTKLRHWAQAVACSVMQSQ